jgi:hypothetical protein
MTMFKKRKSPALVRFALGLPGLVLFLFMAATTLMGEEVLTNPEALLNRFKPLVAPETFRAVLHLEIQRPDRPLKKYELVVWQKSPDLVKIIFQAPASEKGKFLLKKKDQVFLSLPDLEETILLSPAQLSGWNFFFAENLFPFYFTREILWGESRQTPESLILSIIRKTDRSLWVEAALLKPQGPLTGVTLYEPSGKKIRTVSLTWDSSVGSERLKALSIENFYPDSYRAKIGIEDLRTRPVFPDRFFELGTKP